MQTPRTIFEDPTLTLEQKAYALAYYYAEQDGVLDDYLEDYVEAKVAYLFEEVES